MYNARLRWPQGAAGRSVDGMRWADRTWPARGAAFGQVGKPGRCCSAATEYDRRAWHSGPACGPCGHRTPAAVSQAGYAYCQLRDTQLSVQTRRGHGPRGNGAVAGTLALERLVARGAPSGVLSIVLPRPRADPSAKRSTTRKLASLCADALTLVEARRHALGPDRCSRRRGPCPPRHRQYERRTPPAASAFFRSRLLMYSRIV